MQWILKGIMPEEALKIIAAQAEQIRQLTEQVKILTAQLAWFQRQMYGRKSEKLAPYDPNQLSLLTSPLLRRWSKRKNKPQSR